MQFWQLVIATGDNSAISCHSLVLHQLTIVTTQRFTSGQNNVYFSVQPNTSLQMSVQMSTGKDYKSQTEIVNELNTQITAHAALQSALAAVKGYIRFSVVAATPTVAEHIRVSSYMVNMNLLSQGSSDIIRFLGRDFNTAAGAFTLQSGAPWSTAS